VNNPAITIIGSDNFMSPLGAQWTNPSSTQQYPERVKIKRDTGTLEATKLQVRSGATGRTAHFEISSSEIKLIDDKGSTLTSWALS